MIFSREQREAAEELAKRQEEERSERQRRERERIAREHAHARESIQNRKDSLALKDTPLFTVDRFGKF
jgi:hypothetical protein